jgi:hypothetical protein
MEGSILMRKPKCKTGKINLTVTTIPHPNPEAAIDLVAKVVLKNLIEKALLPDA